MGNFNSGGATALQSVPSESSGALQALLGGYSATHPKAPYSVNVLDYLERALNSPNPWVGVQPIETRDIIDSIHARNGLYFSAIAAKLARVESDWSDFYTTAEAKADEVLMDAVDIDAAVDSFEESIKPTYHRNLNAYLSSMYAMNSLESSTVLTGIAILRRGQATDVANFRATLERDRGGQRATFILQAISQMEGAQAQLMGEHRLGAALNTEARVTEFNALREQLNDQLEYGVKKATFQLNMFPFASNIVAAGAGATTSPLGPSKLSTALASGASMAVQGAAIGAQGGVQTAILGALVAGILGFAGGSV